MLDLDSSSTRTAWNKQASILFAFHFAEQPGAIPAKKSDVSTVFLTHLMTLAKEQHLYLTPQEDREALSARAAAENVVKAKDHHL